MPRILIIEDDVYLRRMLTRLLERENFTVLEANNGLEANTILDHTEPNLVITDIIMPEQDGIGTINYIRKNLPGTKIIAISGGGRMIREDYLKIARMLGAEYTFKKPFSNRELVNKVRELI
jgi:two-component system cell cycle response regulator CpdR